jgi:hypothetical protein
MDLIVRHLDRWFAERLQGLKCSPEALAYVAGVLARTRWDGADMSRQSITLAFQDAAVSRDFEGFQRLGDWVLFVDTMYPDHFQLNREIVETFGRRSYYSCHQILRGQWRLYEELADRLPNIAAGARRLLSARTVV